MAHRLTAAHDIYDTVTTVHYTNCWTYGIINDSGGGSSGGSSGGTSGGGGSAGSGSGGSGYDGSAPEIHGNQGVIVTVPVLPQEEPPLPPPCEELEKMIKETFISQALKQNQNEVDDASYETGFSVKIEDNGNTNVAPIDDPSSGCSSLNFAPSTGWIGYIHNHPAECTRSDNFPMFSDHDLAMLYNILYRYKQDHGGWQSCQAILNQFFATVATVNGTYAIKIDNLTAFTNTIGSIFADGPESRAARLFESKMKKRYHSHALNNFDMNMPDAGELEKDFLKFSQIDYNLGISLYKLNTDQTAWSRLVLVDDNLQSKPCN